MPRAASQSIGVLGMWHLGCVTAACLAQAGHDVVVLDPDHEVTAGLREARAPVAEPGLDALLAEQLAAGRLVVADGPESLAGVQQVWVTFDTPVDEEDRADVEWVLETTLGLLDGVGKGALVAVCSQLPVGSVARLELASRERYPEHGLRFACIPENLRLGRALDAFRKPARFVVGTREDADRSELAATLEPLASNILGMRVESAEMTKHALNAFLGTSVAFINEVADLCELVGADAAEVSAGLKSDERIGPQAYLGPGDSFAGGTLARDLTYLEELEVDHALPSHVFHGVIAANAAHKQWAARRLLRLLGSTGSEPLRGRTIAIWGLTYKPGTDTLRRSSAVELCRWLASNGARVQAHDPAVVTLPDDTPRAIVLLGDPLGAAKAADALVLCTPWPEYRAAAGTGVAAAMRNALVLDAGGFLAESLASLPGLTYLRVGAPSPEPAAA
jgi:UDPglucose 6-dehydrogenase